MKRRIIYTKSYAKSYKKLIQNNPKLITKIDNRINIFLSNPIEVDDHPLKGSLKNFRSFSITGDIRIKYKIVDEIYEFILIGTHNQVY